MVIFFPKKKVQCKCSMLWSGLERSYFPLFFCPKTLFYEQPDLFCTAVVWPEIDAWAGAIKGFVAAAAANCNVAPDCPGIAVITGYSVTESQGPGRAGQTVAVWRTLGGCGACLLAADWCERGRKPDAEKGGQWRRAWRREWDWIVIVSVRGLDLADTHTHTPP